MKRLYRVETFYCKQHFVYYVYAKSKCHAFNLVIGQISHIYSKDLNMQDFSDTFVDVILNFLK